jgi:carbon-monoxide dehydrogenase large subunit
MSTGIGAAVPRLEDERFLTGRGRYVDDMAMPGTAYACVLRSPHAHARIVGIDKTAASRAPGVLLILTGEDAVRDKLGGLPCRNAPGTPVGGRFHRPLQPVLANGKVRHVGDRVALVVAETAPQSKDAAELIEVEYQALPAVTLADALGPGAAKVWDDADGNLAFELERGEADATARAFASAAHVTRVKVRYPRAAANTIEPRSALAYRDPLDGRYTLCSSAQSPWYVRDVVAEVLGMPPLSLRVVAPDVGGGFGMKAMIYPEEVMVLWAAGKLDRPVKWTADRSEAIASDTHGRDLMAEAELALSADGRILALRVTAAVNLGAYLSTSAGVPPHNATVSYPGPYHVPHIHAKARAAFTHTAPLGPYRGSGKPEASFVMERLVDKAAREMGIDLVEMRRRNLIAPGAFPYRAATGYVYDGGEFERVLDKALALADWAGFPKRAEESARRGLRRGRGLAMHCQRAGNQSERMEIRVAPSGSVALHVGTHSHGQGHETMFAQMVSEWLGLKLDQVRVFQGDTDRLLYGRGTFAQRSMIAGGSALKVAAEEVVRKGKRLAGWMLEVSEHDIVFANRAFRVEGTDRQVSFEKVAEKSYQGLGLPPEFGVGLDGVGSHPGPNTFPNGCMICEVELEPDTGRVHVRTLTAVDDAGVVVNPLTLDGQLHGSIAQGFGETLIEEVVYDRESAQLLTGTFMDYGMPRASDMPDIRSEVHPVPAKTNLLGVKGGAEAGNAGAPPAILHAVLDALAPWGVTDIEMPLTPERVWRAINRS